MDHEFAAKAAVALIPLLVYRNGPEKHKAKRVNWGDAVDSA
jgi:hypothetical protein